MKPCLIEFTYTKDNGEVSEREVITISQPTELLLCLDLGKDTAIETEDISDILKQLTRIEEQRLKDIYKVAATYGLSTSIKTFKNKGISKVINNTENYKVKKENT